MGDSFTAKRRSASTPGGHYSNSALCLNSDETLHSLAGPGGIRYANWDPPQGPQVARSVACFPLAGKLRKVASHFPHFRLRSATQVRQAVLLALHDTEKSLSGNAVIYTAAASVLVDMLLFTHPAVLSPAARPPIFGVPILALSGAES